MVRPEHLSTVHALHTVSNLPSAFRSTALDGNRHLYQLTGFSGPQHSSKLVGLARELGSHLGEVRHLVMGSEISL